MRNSKVQQLCRMALMTALTIVFSKFLSFYLTESLKVSTTFVPLSLCAMLMGPVPTAVVAFLADFLGTLISNTTILAIDPRFSITAAIMGLIFALFLYRDKVTFWHILAAVVLNLLICTLGLNTLWLSQLTGVPYMAKLVTRLPQTVAAAVQLVVIPLLYRYVYPQLRRATGAGFRKNK